jgi:hypothetical protein
MIKDPAAIVQQDNNKPKKVGPDPAAFKLKKGA